MNSLRRLALVASLAGVGALAPMSTLAQSTDPHQHDKDAPQQPRMPGGGMGMGGAGMGGGMMQMMEHCQQMMSQRGSGPRGLPQLPPGNEKLQLQMHADMMRAMADIVGKYAARLPDRK